MNDEMTVQSLNDIVDLSDFGKSTKFKYDGKVYEIPYVSSSKAAKIISMVRRSMKESRIFMNKEKRYNTLLEKQEDSEEITPEEVIELASLEKEIEDFATSFSNQIALIKETVKDITSEEIMEWPSRMVGRVTNMIENHMTGNKNEDEKKS